MQSWEQWQYADDDERVCSLRVYTDGSAELTNAWPRHFVKAGWGALIVADTARGSGVDDGQRWLKYLGAIWGPCQVSNDPRQQFVLSSPSAPAAEVAAIAAVLRLTRFYAADAAEAVGGLAGPPWISSDFTGFHWWCDCKSALDVVMLRSRASSNTRLVRRTRLDWRLVASGRRSSGQHARGHSGNSEN